MNFAAILFANLLRIALGIAVICHLFKRNYKPAIFAAGAFALTYLPFVLDRFFSYRLDPVGNILYYTIIVMTVYLGSSLKYYDRFAWWDYVIHFLSGCLFVNAGIALADMTVYLNRFPVLFFSFTLSITLHVVWEVLEYVFDCLFRSDNQRWQKISPTRNHQPESAIQPAGLVDTMNDTLICILGTVIACFAWWVILGNVGR